MKHHKIIQLLGIFFIVITVGCGNKENKVIEKELRYVKIQNIEDGSEKIKLVFNGTVKENSLIKLSFRVGGPLTKLSVKQGDYIKAGSLIAKIDNRDYQIQVEAKKAQYMQIKGEYARYKELHEKKKIPANTYEKVEAGYLLAKSAYEHAQHQLKDTELRAPISGYIFNKFTENHQTVAPGHPIVSIIDKSTMEVIVYVPENQLNDIRKSKDNRLRIKSANVSGVPVSITNIAEKSNAAGLYEVKFAFNENKKMSVSPGMTAEITMSYKSNDSGISIPANAIFNNNNNTCVWVYNKKSTIIKKRKINISTFQSDGKIKVMSGLNAGETIVVAGVNYLLDNQKVKPIQEPSKSNIGGLL